MGNNQHFSRRTFIGTAGIATAAIGAGASCGLAFAEEPDWTYAADVVVVGSGAAGHAAAIEAATYGAHVVILEKSENKIGGDSALCDGILGGWGTRMCKEQGIDLGPDEIYQLFMSNPDWYGPHDPGLARLAAEECGNTVDWLEDMGVPFEPEVKPRFNYTDLPAIHQVEGKGAKMIEVMAAMAAELGVETMIGTPVIDLIEQDGRVTGVRALQNGEPITIQARGGVVLATGGYGASYEMLTSLDPENAGIMPLSLPTNQGDGIVMAQKLGGHITRTAYQPMMHSLGGLGTGYVLNMDYEKRLHGILLDINGSRFCNEGMEFLSRNVPRAALRKTNEQQGIPPVLLIPSSEASAYLTDQPTFDWPAFETVADVAAAFGIDPVGAEETAERYNGFVANGLDEDFGRPAEDMVPLTGPFYATPISVITNVTTGGIKTDIDMRVLRMRNLGEDGPLLQPIPGLYAAGETCEWNVAAGWTVLTCMTFGRIAGANAAPRG